jgi:hypothetical protein
MDLYRVGGVIDDNDVAGTLVSTYSTQFCAIQVQEASVFTMRMRHRIRLVLMTCQEHRGMARIQAS